MLIILVKLFISVSYTRTLIMNKIIIFKLGEQKVDKARQLSHFCPLFLFSKEKRNLLNQGLEFGTVLAI